MPKGKLFPALFLLIVIGLFVYGVTELLILRFQKGNVYPPYSSYRSDPLGSKAFYEGLGLLGGVETLRNVGPLPKVSGLSETTLFLFGLQAFAMQPTAVQPLEDAALGGGRIVISFVPTHSRSASPSKKKGKPETPQEEAKRQQDEEEDQEQEFYGQGYVDLAKRWRVETKLSAEKDGEARLRAAGEDLHPSIAWYSNLIFEPQDDAWRTIYTRAGKPVLIERSYGKGTIVLSSDSFFLSNEAMKSRRYPRLLSWLCGTHQKIIFDETHLGVSKNPGIATLLRKYGLAPFFMALMVLALLAIWRQSSRFVPADEEDEPAPVDAGKDTSTGLTNLLRRNIAPDHVLTACLEEWKRSFTHGKQNLSALLPHIQEIIAPDGARSKKNRNPVQAYRKISVLAKRR